MAMDHHEMRPKFGEKVANSNVVSDTDGIYLIFSPVLEHISVTFA